MDYDLSQEQNILKESAHKLLAKECTSEHVRQMVEDERGFSPELWDKMAELGWMSLLVPEEYGGSGVSFLDLAVLLSEMGYYCLPGPFFSTVVQAGMAVLEAGNEAQKAEILPEIAEGKRKATLAWIEEDYSYSPDGIRLVAEPEDDQAVLTGTKLFVPDAQVADTIICAARTGDDDTDVSLFLVEAGSPGITIDPLDTLAGDKQCAVTFDKVRIPKSNLLGEFNRAWPVLEKVLLKAAVAKSAEMAGGAERIMEMVVPYAKGRKQFGRPVGAFQAVQHHCADMLTFEDTITFMVYQAAWRIQAGLPFEQEASICKAWVSDAYRKLVALGHQVIGGVGFMEEYDLQLYFKRAKAAEQMFGDADYHRELVAREMGL
ncbi:MAG: acyl-CoA/acyl-ACP dehydrogenase [Proteobacteria bacterium]|nr:acyl-CoA/acyl-ACP dehydrogenase [Pseudomonadota bacterium]